MKSKKEGKIEVKFRQILKYENGTSAVFSIPKKWYDELGFDPEYLIKLTKDGNKIIIENMKETLENEVRLAEKKSTESEKILKKAEKDLEKTNNDSNSGKEESMGFVEIKPKPSTEASEDTTPEEEEIEELPPFDYTKFDEETENNDEPTTKEPKEEENIKFVEVIPEPTTETSEDQKPMTIEEYKEGRNEHKSE